VSIVRVLVIGVQPDHDQLVEELNRATAPADQAVLIYLPRDPASEAAARLWTGPGYRLDPVSDLPTAEVLAGWKLRELRPDVVLVCQPTGTRHPLAAHARENAKSSGASVRELALAAS
jgi:hypothetical protein